jgi:hypothetical protein
LILKHGDGEIEYTEDAIAALKPQLLEFADGG